MASKMVKISEFAKQYGISDRHARRLVAENESELCGHFEKRGNGGTWIDEVAAEILRGKLRNPQEYVQLTIDEVDQAALQQQIIDLQGQLLEAYKAMAEERNARAGLILELGKQQLLAAQTDTEKERADRAEERAAQAATDLQQAKETVEIIRREAKMRCDQAQEAEERQLEAEERARAAEDVAELNAQEAERAKAEAAELREKIEKLKKRGLWARIRNREA